MSTRQELLAHAIEEYDTRMCAFLRALRAHIEEHPEPEPGDSADIAELKRRVRIIDTLCAGYTEPNVQPQAA